MALVVAVVLMAPLGATLMPVAFASGAPLPQAVIGVTETARLLYGGRIAQAAYSPDGQHLAVAVANGPVLVLNSTTLATELNLTTQPTWVTVSSLSWGPKSDKIGVGYQGGAVAVWRVPSGTSAWAVSGLYFDVRGVAWSPDGKFLAAGIVHSIYIYWGESGYLNATLSLDYGGSQPAGLSWSHDSDYLAVGQQAYAPTGAIVALFEAKSWTKALGWRWVGPGMDHVAFEGRGRFLAVQLGGSRVEVWQVRNWTLFANLSSTSGLEQFAWTVDGSRLVTLETEPSALPNQTQDFGGFEVLHLGGGNGNSSAVGVSPDGRTVAVGYFNGTVRLLDIGGERFFDDLTPLVGTTGDPLTFSVRSTVAGTVQVVYSDSSGLRLTSATLSSSGGRHTLTITVPSDWSGPVLYHFAMTSAGLVSPERMIRIQDNDAPVVAAWNFTRLGATGETGAANITVSDNIRLQSATFQLAVDGVAVASASAGDNATLWFSLSTPLSPENRSVRLELVATDTAGNGGTTFQTVIPLDDRVPPRLGADLSQPGTAGGRIQLGIVATDERGPPAVTVTWRELTSTGELAWSNFTYGLPGSGSTSYFTTFPLGRTTVAVEYYFTAADSAGNTNATLTAVQQVTDREPPEIVVDLSDREVYQGGEFHLAVVVRDNIGVPSVTASVQQDGGASVLLNMTGWPTYGEGAFEGRFTVGANATTFVYEFFVTDGEGNTISSGKRTLVAKDNQPPLIRILEPVLKVTAGGALTFHVEVIDRSDVGNLTVHFKRAGETAYLQQEFTADSKLKTNVTTARFSVPLAALGVSTHRDGRAVLVYLFVLDGALNGGTLGAPDAPVVIEVLDGVPPVARFETAGDLVVGSLISFDGSASDDDLAVVSYAWVVDDAEVGNRSSLAWRFTSPGEHTVKLVVKDASNKTASQTQTVTVMSPATETAGLGATVLFAVIGAVGAAAVIAVLYLRRPKKPAGEQGEGAP